jgi:hypothetical protein
MGKVTKKAATKTTNKAATALIQVLSFSTLIP